LQEALEEEAGDMWGDASIIMKCGKEIQTLLGTPSAGYAEVAEVPRIPMICDGCSEPMDTPKMICSEFRAFFFAI
jgi:hypothetical protein